MIENNNLIDLMNYNIIISLVLFFVLAPYFGHLLFANLNLKKNNIKLKQLNKSNIDTLNEKNLQLKEINHRIKNNLQLIVSLLNIEADNEKVNSINEFLLKGQTRIHSISALHQNLYETEHNDVINLQKYVESIVNNLIQIYHNEIEFEIKAHEILLDIEIAIPIGLIITELVCNAFKHAFIVNKKGKIFIEIKKNNLNKYEMTLNDNGIGFQDLPEPKISVGLDIVSLMVLQINGKLLRENKQGAFYSIIF